MIVKLCRVKNVLENNNVCISVRIVTAILLLYYHHKKSIESTMCRPRPYITGALHFRWLSFLLKIITFCLYVCNSSTKFVFFRIFFWLNLLKKKQFLYVYDCPLH